MLNLTKQQIVIVSFYPDLRTVKKAMIYLVKCNFQVKDIWEMDNTDKLDQCAIFKDKGNDYFKVWNCYCNSDTMWTL